MKEGAGHEKMVGERGFEPPAPASRRQCSTRLSYSPTRDSGRIPKKAGAPLSERMHTVQGQAQKKHEMMFGAQGNLDSARAFF